MKNCLQYSNYSFNHEPLRPLWPIFCCSLSWPIRYINVKLLMVKYWNVTVPIQSSLLLIQAFAGKKSFSWNFTNCSQIPLNVFTQVTRYHTTSTQSRLDSLVNRKWIGTQQRSTELKQTQALSASILFPDHLPIVRLELSAHDQSKTLPERDTQLPSQGQSLSLKLFN